MGRWRYDRKFRGADRAQVCTALILIPFSGMKKSPITKKWSAILFIPKKGIKIGVRPTSREVGNEGKRLSDIYPKTPMALRKAGYLRNSKLPKLGEILDRRGIDMAESSIRWEKNGQKIKEVFM